MADARHRLLSAFTEHRDALLRFLHRRLNNTALAEDLAQETWLRAANAQSTATIDNPRGFLFRIAANLALDHQRHVAHRIELAAAPAVAEAVPDPQPSPESIALHRSEFVRLLRIVEGLSPRCREVFILGKFEGLSLAEIAARLNISRNTVVTHMVNALAAIEREMSDTKS
jgi:RNA polymerase sigma-70 factor (ECF subfamily)